MNSQQQRIQVKGELVAVYSVAQVPCANRGLTKLLETVQPLLLLSKQGISHLTVQNCRYSFAFSEKMNKVGAALCRVIRQLCGVYFSFD